MIYNLSNEYDRQRFEKTTSEMLSQNAVVELKRKHQARTLKQNAYLHLLLGWYACEYGCTLDEVKVDVYKRVCNRELFEIEITNKRGQKITTLRSSSVLDSAEMTLSIERFRNYSSSVAGIYLPSPNESDFLDYIRNEIEKNNGLL
jgi:hypothetical protein